MLEAASAWAVQYDHLGTKVAQSVKSCHNGAWPGMKYCQVLLVRHFSYHLKHFTHESSLFGPPISAFSSPCQVLCALRPPALLPGGPASSPTRISFAISSRLCRSRSDRAGMFMPSHTVSESSPTTTARSAALSPVQCPCHIPDFEPGVGAVEEGHALRSRLIFIRPEKPSKPCKARAISSPVQS